MGKYRVVLCAAKLGNLTKTAQVLGYSQSNISHMLRNIEDDLGITIFHRERYGVVLTKVGKELLPVMEQIEALEKSLGEIAASYHAQSLKIGSFYSVSNYWIPPILKRFSLQYPSIKVTVLERESYLGVEELLQRKEVDFAFWGGNYKGNFEFIPLCEDPYYLIVSQRHSLAKETSVSIQVIAQYPFIMPSEALDSGVSQEIIRTVQASAHLNLIAHSQEDHTTLNLVEHDLGISFLPGLIARNTKRNICAIPIQEGYKRTLGIICKSSRNLSQAAKSFVRVTREYVTLTAS